MTMTAEEQTSEGQHTVPMEGEDITPKKDGGVLKVKYSVSVFRQRAEGVAGLLLRPNARLMLEMVSCLLSVYLM